MKSHLSFTIKFDIFFKIYDADIIYSHIFNILFMFFFCNKTNILMFSIFCCTDVMLSQSHEITLWYAMK